jgi:Cys-rich protein (TIGR01571 family)
MEWSTGLFSCMEDISNTFVTCLFPCITIAYNKALLKRRPVPPPLADVYCEFCSNPFYEIYQQRVEIQTRADMKVS